MPGPEKHDVTADPLTPYWRAKVEAAAKITVQAARAPSPSDLSPRDALFLRLWGTGAPAETVAAHVGVSYAPYCYKLAQRLRLQGYEPSPRRPRQPPVDWQQRVDRIIESGG